MGAPPAPPPVPVHAGALFDSLARAWPLAFTRKAFSGLLKVRLAGRQVLVLDAERAPSHLRGGVSWAAAAMLLFMVLAAVWLCAGRPGL